MIFSEETEIGIESLDGRGHEVNDNAIAHARNGAVVPARIQCSYLEVFTG